MSENVKIDISDVAPERRPSIKELNRFQDGLIDENVYYVVQIRNALVGPDGTLDSVDVDRSTIEMNFRTNNNILAMTNSILHDIVDILGLDIEPLARKETTTSCRN